MKTLLLIAVLILILLAAGAYVYKAKKRGEKCVGCPYCKDCNGSCK